MSKRNGFAWSVNEILSLQREYELLGWSIDQIARKHQRTPMAIMYKLDQEGFADYSILFSDYNVNKYIYKESDKGSDEESDTVSLAQRVTGLEDSIAEIKTMLMNFSKTHNKKDKKVSKSSRMPLRTPLF